jgi:CRP-like cAMP-binding protein
MKPAEEEEARMVNYVNFLKQADIFDQLTNTQLEMIVEICHEEIFQAGELIFPEGSESDELYIIVQGKADIFLTSYPVNHHPNMGYSQNLLAQLRPGQSFGEVALVDHGLRSATARASQSNTRLLVIPRQTLMEICEQYPQLGYRLMKNLALDLALKLRITDLRTREENLDAPSK